MGTLLRKATWKIAIYGREHGVPHFHIEGKGFRCSISIQTLDLIVGSAPRAVLREALDWARENRALLETEWQRLNG